VQFKHYQNSSNNCSELVTVPQTDGKKDCIQSWMIGFKNCHHMALVNYYESRIRRGTFVHCLVVLLRRMITWTMYSVLRCNQPLTSYCESRKCCKFTRLVRHHHHHHHGSLSRPTNQNPENLCCFAGVVGRTCLKNKRTKI